MKTAIKYINEKMALKVQLLNFFFVFTLKPRVE